MTTAATGTMSSFATSATALGIRNGCDMDCGSFYTDAGPAAVAQGLLRNATIDRALRRIFTMRIRLGEFDPPADVPYSAYGAADCDSAQGRALALQAAREAIVLLNNSLGLLPLLKKKKTTTTKSGFNRIAVLGPLANSTAVMMGGKTDYSPSFTVTALAGIRSAIRRMNVSTIVDYSPGLSSAGSTNASLLPAAIALASASDLVIVVVGISGANEGEGHDRANTTLPGLQVSLFFPFIS
jgi:pre-mRNA-splicing factor SYF2/beta-D-xylosidase 4